MTKDKDTERRRSRRMDVLESFSLFITVPKKGPHRLKVHDLSDTGVGFDLDIEDEGSAAFPAEKDTVLDVQLYINQSIFLPLSLQIRRVQEKGGIRRVGAEFVSKNSKGHIALLAFLDMLDAIAEVPVSV